MKFSLFGRFAMAVFASAVLGLGMTGCGGGTIAFMWVLGQQYNQIAGFKVDNYTGNLTQIPHQPFSSGGATPVTLVVKPGGRYLYVLNQGTGGGLQTVNGVTSVVKGTSSNISLFSVGGDGVLTFQQSYQSQGAVPQWLQFDSTGGYLYVLDKYSPSGNGNGSITVFASDGTTGRLTLVTNTQSIPSGGTALTYFEVGASPFQMKSAGSCLFTVNSADQSITPYAFGSAGQLTTVTTGKIFTSVGSISSINGNASYMILTDTANNQIFAYNIGTGCALNAISGGGIVKNFAGTSNPVWSLISNSGKYLYVLNQSTTTTTSNTPYSSVSAFVFSSGQLTPISGAPYRSGAGPVCMVEDPTNQYLFTSDRNAGTLTGLPVSRRYGRAVHAFARQQLYRDRACKLSGDQRCRDLETCAHSCGNAAGERLPFLTRLPLARIHLSSPIGLASKGIP